MRVSYLKLLLILLSCATGAIAIPAEVIINPDFQSVEKGQDFTVNISIDPVNNPITGAQFNLFFDSSYIKIINIAEGSLFKQGGANTTFSSGILNNTGGTLLNVWGLIITPGANVTTRGTIAEITMIAENTGISGLDLTNVIVSDPESREVDINRTNGSVSVRSADGVVLRESSSSGSSGSSGGGGGAGGTSGEDFYNIDIKEKYDRFIHKDILTPYCFRNIKNPIICVNITGNTSPGEINTAVEVLRNTSSLVKSPAPDTVYKNINIWVGNYGYATPANINHAEITFRVPVSWIGSNGIDPDSITMMHYYQDAWESLPTKKISETSEWIYYEASTKRFSPHAITGKKSYSESYNFVAQTAPITETQHKVIQVSNAGNDAGIPGNLNKNLIFGVLIGILLNASLIYNMKKQKENDIFN